jgi:NAD(P)-dependent dehydrogenase (short-subunit alcohol dehydrogenase family)
VTAADADSTLLAAPPSLRFDGRAVWVTGAGRGLGRAVALALAGAGAELVLSGRTAETLEEVAGLIEENGGKARAMIGSVSDPGDVAATVGAVEAEFGRLDVLVNNAGISPYFKRSEELGDDELREVLETNLVGAFACARAALPLLRMGEEPCIVNISSIHGSRAHGRILAYAASKGGVEMMTRTLAEEWAGHGVRVNSLAPGYVETEMSEGLRDHPSWGAELLGRTPLGRFATSAEIAACAMFLASPISSYVTGTTLFADGGWSAR